MTATKHGELQRRRRAYEWKARWNRLWWYREGSWKHLLVACLTPLRYQAPLRNVVAAATIIGMGGGASIVAGGSLGTGMLFAAGALSVVMAGAGLIRFSRERRSRFDRPPGAGPEQAGVREPRRPPRGGGEMSAALDLESDESG